jgi:myo-inositol-1(or 4)-monophosphatase
MHPMLNTAVKAARQAGSIILRAAEDIDQLTIKNKSANDFVSEVDVASEEAIINILKTAYPTHGFLGEESGFSDKDADYIWIIDPLDGTTNFLHQFPQYCISIALMHKGDITHAVIYDPNRNDLFTATKGAGAYLNDKRIRVSKKAKLNESIIGTGFPFRDFAHLPCYLKMFEEMITNTSGLRRPGSAALDLAYVAAGWFDGFWEIGLSKWDIAAGALLVKEAGGIVSDFNEKQAWMKTGNIIAANAKIYGDFIKIIQKNMSEELKNQ